MSARALPASRAIETPLDVSRSPGPLPGMWLVTLACGHGVTTGYLVADRLELPQEATAVLGLIADRHRRERARCACEPARTGRRVTPPPTANGHRTEGD